MTRMNTTVRVAAYAVAVVSWVICFRLLVAYGTWLPFVGAGTLLAGFELLTDRRARSLVCPTGARVAAGVLGTALMLAGTYAGFALLRGLVPSLETQTASLYTLLRASHFSDLHRAALILVVASTEEVVFRGALLGDDPPTSGAWRDLAGLSRVVPCAALYALTAASSGSVLLVVVAWTCGLYWGVLRILTRSVFAPIVCHVAWDLAVLVFRPLL